MKKKIKRYLLNFRKLDFEKKHHALGNVATMVAAFASLVTALVTLIVGIYVFRAQYDLQKRQQNLAEEQWQWSLNDRHKKDVQDESKKWFALDEIDTAEAQTIK